MSHETGILPKKDPLTINIGRNVQRRDVSNVEKYFGCFKETEFLKTVVLFYVLFLRQGFSV